MRLEPVPTVCELGGQANWPLLFQLAAWFKQVRLALKQASCFCCLEDYSDHDEVAMS